MINFDFITNTVTLLLVLSALVVAHEWGHFIMARLFKIRVDDFSIGFGKRIWRIGKLGDTEYNVRILPLGGFVKIAGMEADEEPITKAKDAVFKRGVKEDDPDSAEMPLIAENTAELFPHDDPNGFNHKPLWQRSLVILGGPVMSLLTGVIIYCLMGVTVGAPTGKALNRVVFVNPGGEGQKIGLHAGDQILEINGEPIHNGYEMVRDIQTHLDQQITLRVLHNGIISTKVATPRPRMDDKTNKPFLVFDVKDPGPLAQIGLLPGDRIQSVNGKDVTGISDFENDLRAVVGEKATIGVGRDLLEYHEVKGVVPVAAATHLPTIDAHPYGVLDFQPDYALEHVGFVQSVKQGLQMTVAMFKTYAGLIQNHELHKSAGGIVKMYSYTGIAVKNGASSVLQLAANITISLGIFNLLPIPVLDGGHLLAFFVEWVRRGKKMTPEQHQAFLMTGLAIILILFVLIMGHDILDVVHHHIQQ